MPPDATAPPADDQVAGAETDAPRRDRWDVLLVVMVSVALAVGVVLRFVTRSPFWLDEALSANIAHLPIGDIPEALRHDGHPPLFYVLLHGWMSVFGGGDVAVRAFSGVFGLALIPLVWLAAKRLGGRLVAWYALGVLALSPYALRYATETRMYAMVMVLVVAGWLLLDDCLRRPNAWRLVGLALVTGLLLWTHYWSMWLLGVTGLALIVRAVRAHRAGDGDRARATRNAILAIVVGGLLFVPWLPSLLYQGAHTGTPWARPLRPTEMITYTLADLGGGGQAEAIVLGWFTALLVLVGATGRSTGATTFEVDLRTRRIARPFLLAVLGTLAVGCVVGYATSATYASRYAAVFVPFLLLLAALGLAVLDRRVAIGALAILLGLGTIGAYRNVTVDRSDARQSADAIIANGAKGDLVVYCPDQLGPSTNRRLPAGFDQVTYPRFERPELIDWTDYKARLAKASPERFAQQLLDRAGDRNIFLVYSTSYITHEETCPALFNAIGKVRPPDVLTSTTKAFEPSAVVEFPAPRR
ncbi:MAG: glycosyltransferase family 39 protein [Acidimicrobiales bacterium]